MPNNKLFSKYIPLSLTVLSICLSAHIARSHPLINIDFPLYQVSPKVVVTVEKELLTKDLSTQNFSNITALAQKARKSYETGRFDDAVKTWQLAAKAYRSNGDMLNYAQSLNQLSLAYQQLGSYSQASKTIGTSLELLQDEGVNSSAPQQVQLIAQALNIQGQLQLAQGRAEQALAIWKRGEVAYTQAGDEVGVNGSLLNQAQALQVLGFDRRAVEILESVNQKLQKQPDSQLKVEGLRGLGKALYQVGEIERSRINLEQSLALAKKLNLPTDIAAAKLSLGNVLRLQQDHKVALSYYQQAAAASESLTTQVQAQLNQLSLLVETKQVSALQTMLPEIEAKINQMPLNRATIYAQINYTQSLKKFKQAATSDSPSWEEIARILANGVEQAKALKDSRAESYVLGSLGEVYEQTQQWSIAKDLTEQALVMSQATNAPDIAYRWHWQLGRLLKARGDTTGAIANYTQAINALKSLRSDLVTVNPEIQFNFRDQVEPVYRQLVDLLLQPEKPSQQNLITARETIEALQLAELDNYFQTACLEGKPVQIDQVIDQEDPTAAVIYPIILKERLEVILKLPGQRLRHYRTKIAQNELEDHLEELGQQLTKSYAFEETSSLSQQVYNWLIRPAVTDLAASQVKTLVFVLDGALRNIPMASLYDGQQYLIEKYAVTLTPGLQLLPPQAIERVKLEALTAGVSEAHKGFSALTNVGLELKQIKSEVPTMVLLNQEFTSTALSKELNSDPVPLVHFATHGQFSSIAAKTFILAWDKPIVMNELSNLLRFAGTSQRHAIELLILSACQTATGDKRAALGLAGVAIRSGARSTLASLWSLDDESSALLMGQFYRVLNEQRVNKAEALRRAQLALLQNPRYQSPQHWAAFVLVGNWL